MNTSQFKLIIIGTFLLVLLEAISFFYTESQPWEYISFFLAIATIVLIAYLGFKWKLTNKEIYIAIIFTHIALAIIEFTSVFIIYQDLFIPLVIFFWTLLSTIGALIYAFISLKIMRKTNT